ncbi:MAG: hypothetical protein J7M29_12735 [Verrucomicrobia bacterium]|nr:hypothetical protein [Verrucomicrobiota bacterium]
MKNTPAEPERVTLDLAKLFADTGQAKLADLPRYEARALEQTPPGADVILTGRAPVWLYLRVAHLLHGRARILTYDSPVTGPVEIFNHNPR